LFQVLLTLSLSWNKPETADVFWERFERSYRMKRRLVRFVLLGTELVVFSMAALAQTASQAGGHWQGKIQIPNRELGISVDLAQSPNGAWTGSMSVVGSSAMDVPLSGIRVEGAAVRFTAKLPEQASFDARLSADAGSLSGTASSAAGDAPFQLTRNGEANVKTPAASSRLSKEFEGAWEGSHEAGGKVRRIGLKLAAAADGTATATLIAVEQNLEIPVNTVTIRDKELQLEARAVSGIYRGTLGANGEIAGEWVEGANRTPVTFRRKP
jgi:hypothetical protein